MKIFDANAYFKEVTKNNKLLKKNDFVFTRMSSINLAEEVLRKMNKHNSILALSDTNDGVLELKGGGTYFKRRVFTVYLLRKCKLNDMDDYSDNLELCRKIFHSILSKLVVDSDLFKNHSINIDTNRVSFKEIDSYLLNGHSGLYFMFIVDEPTELCYDETEWS